MGICSLWQLAAFVDTKALEIPVVVQLLAIHTATGLPPIWNVQLAYHLDGVERFDGPVCSRHTHNIAHLTKMPGKGTFARLRRTF
jgi:hypothetical protein